MGKVDSRRLLEHAIELDRARAWLMRCDRVDFGPGDVALLHGHAGGGQSSIVYVDPADAGRGRPQRDTIYVDKPIDLP